MRAEWAIMGQVLVPMLCLLSITPEASQMAYRIGDSVACDVLLAGSG